MAESARLFMSRLAFSLAEQARRQARERTRSETIAASMQLKLLDFGKVAVEVPFYWAVYYHDGRGPIKARKGKKIVFFKDPDDDPRINGAARNYPVRAENIRRLSRAQFFRFLKQGKIIAVDRVGRAKGDPFFTRGLRSFPKKAGRRGTREFRAFVKRDLGDLRRLKLRTVIGV